MPALPRLLLVVAGVCTGALNGIASSDGVLDLLGGVLIIAAVLWPGCELFVNTMDDAEPRTYVMRCPWHGWPDRTKIRRLTGERDAPLHLTRYWRWPFPPWPAYRELQ